MLKTDISRAQGDIFRLRVSPPKIFDLHVHKTEKSSKSLTFNAGSRF